MRIRLFTAPERSDYDTVVAQLKQCRSDVEEYLRIKNNPEKKNELLKRITATVPSGVYMPGCGTSQEAFFVEGVQRKQGKRNAEQAFCVVYAGLLKSDGDELAYDGKFGAFRLVEKPAKPRLKRSEILLVDTAGFLCPITRDGYRGPRFVRVGEVL